MTLRLILMRHAKSSWDIPALDDHARPLNARGDKSARALGDWLRQKSYLPDTALSSDSARTRATMAGLALDCPVRFTPRLYHADPMTMLMELRRSTGQSVLMIGHNPGIGVFADRILVTRPRHPRFADYPTCATLVAEFPQEKWAEVEFTTAAHIDFVIPRELT